MEHPLKVFDEILDGLLLTLIAIPAVWHMDLPETVEVLLSGNGLGLICNSFSDTNESFSEMNGERRNVGVDYFLDSFRAKLLNSRGQFPSPFC